MSLARAFAATLAFVPMLVAGAAPAATLLVAPNGVDSGGCGPKGTPCRTITRAIANAGIDDTVVVAPGRYGDTNGDLAISGPNEETPNVNGCNCILEIGKRVTVVSRDGAAATVIDGGKSNLSDTIRLSADGAVFGKKNKGFTITNGPSAAAGLLVIANGTTVTGHLFIDNPSHGIALEGSRNLVTASRLFSKNGDGMLVTGEDNTITETAASGGAGFSGSGFNISGNRNTLRGVFATGHAIGISLLGNGHTVSGSVVVQNTRAGIDLAGTGSSAVVAKSTMHSNGILFLDNCGLSLSGTNSTVVATGNYWGAPTGPGSDPADTACITTGSTATTTPFATKEHKTPTKPLR